MKIASLTHCTAKKKFPSEISINEIREKPET